MVVRENLGWEEVARVEFNAPDLPGVFIDLGQTRDYPEGELMSHIIGYTGRVADEDLAGRDDPVLQLATMRFGKKGVERSLEDDLRGRAGAVQVEVNSVGRVVRELDRTEGQPGSNALLTIDLDLQRFATERMKEHQSGSVVVLDVDHRRRAGHGVDARLRSQHLRPRHHPERMARAARQPGAPAQQQGDRRRLSAGLDLQDGDGAGRPRIQGDRSVDAAALQRLHRARQTSNSIAG